MFLQPPMVRTKSYKKLPYKALKNLTRDSAVDILLESGTIIANQNADKTVYKDSTDAGKHMGELSQTTLTIQENFGAVLKLNPNEYTIAVDSVRIPKTG